jgi:hypothetical protein
LSAITSTCLQASAFCSIRGFWRSFGLAVAIIFFAGCSTSRPQTRFNSRPFAFHRDTFAYANKLVWRYDFDPATGKMTHVREVPKPAYTHHCFVVARAARQFFDNARFDPSLPVVDTNAYRLLVRKIMAQSPRRPLEEPIIIPGYSNLFDFSRAQENLLQAECGGAWQSYFQRGHWRMIFPMTTNHQHRIARQLAAKLKGHQAPLVHIVRFPKLSINHAIVLFDCKTTNDGLEFSAYDPNDPDRPLAITFHSSDGHFAIPRTRYFAGGRVDVYEIFHTWNY